MEEQDLDHLMKLARRLPTVSVNYLLCTLSPYTYVSTRSLQPAPA